MSKMIPVEAKDLVAVEGGLAFSDATALFGSVAVQTDLSKHISASMRNYSTQVAVGNVGPGTQTNAHLNSISAQGRLGPEACHGRGGWRSHPPRLPEARGRSAGLGVWQRHPFSSRGAARTRKSRPVVSGPGRDS